LLIEQGTVLKALEIKSGKTIHPDFFKALNDFAKLSGTVACYLIFGGNEFQRRSNITVLGIGDLDKIK